MDRVNQKLCFVQSGFENIPRGVAYRKGLVQSRSKGGEVGGIGGGRGVEVCTEQSH